MAKQSFKGIAIVTESIYEELKSQGKIDPNLLYVEDLFVKSPKKISDLEKDDNTIVRTTGDYNITGIKQFELIKLTESLQDENGENILDFTNGNINFGNSNIMLLLKGSQERPYYNNSENTLAFFSDIPSVVDALNSQDSSKTLSANQGRILNEKITNIVETLNSKNQAFTIQSLSDLGTLFNIDITEIKNEYGVETSTITYKDKTYTLKNGDVFLIVDTNVPDYWFSLDDMTLYRMETSKVDLSNYVTKDDLKTLQDEVDKKLSIEDYVVDSELSDSSENPVQNKVIDAKVKEVKQSILTVEEKIPTTYVKSINGESGEVSGIATEQFVKDKINEIPTPDVSDQIEEHNEDEEAHPYIRNLIPTDYYKVKNKLSSVDLNTIVIPGNYGVANTCINLPVSGATGTMFVGNYLNNTYAQQLFITSDNIMYIRSSTNIDNTNWTEWAKTASDNELKIIQDSMPKDLSDLANVADGVVDNQYATKKYVKDYVVDITASELEGYVSGLNYYSEDVFNVTTDPAGEPNKSYDYYSMDYDKNMAIQPIIGEEVEITYRRDSSSSHHPFITACTYDMIWDTENPNKISFKYTGPTDVEVNNGNVAVTVFGDNFFYPAVSVLPLESNSSYYVKITSVTTNGDGQTQNKHFGLLYLSCGYSSREMQTSNGRPYFTSGIDTKRGKYLPRRKTNEFLLNTGPEANSFLMLDTLLPKTNGWTYTYTFEIRKAETNINKIIEENEYIQSKANANDIPTDNSQLTNGAGYQTADNVNTLISNATQNMLTTNNYSSTLDDVYQQVGDYATINDLDAKQDTLNSTQLQAVNSGANTTNINQITTNSNDINTINSKIPNQASSTNQLADRDFVNSSLNSITAFYITSNANGDPFATKSALTTATTYYSGGQVTTPTRNDYAIVLSDETKDNATTRYIYYNQWEYQYTVNETSLTADQLSAINSGITSTLVGKISSNEQMINSLAEQVVNDYVPDTRTINGKSLSSNITLNASDVGVNITLNGNQTANPSFYAPDTVGENSQILTSSGSTTKTPRWQNVSSITDEQNTTKTSMKSSVWKTKTWSGLTTFYGSNIWTDGENVYYSEGANQYVLNKVNSTWEPKTWSGLTSFNGTYIWSNGDNIYYSYNYDQFELDISTGTWKNKAWAGLGTNKINGNYIWSDGKTTYYSEGSKQYSLSFKSSQWYTKTWNGFSSYESTNFYGYDVWFDGTNIRYKTLALDVSTSTWNYKTGAAGMSDFYGRYVWTDGEHIYYSRYTPSGSTYSYMYFDKSRLTWLGTSWEGEYHGSGNDIWTDGENVYFSNGTKHLVLEKIARGNVNSKPYLGKLIAKDVGTYSKSEIDALLKSNMPDTSGFVPNTRTVNGKELSSDISLGNKDVGALPDYTLTINHGTAGNPRMVKFASVNYTSAATCFKMGAMTCHDNGVSYQFLTDMLIAVTAAGEVTANIYKFAQSSVGNVDGIARYTGDVFYVNDTESKIVDFYILCGQYSSSQFTPATKVGSTTIANVTQYTGYATYYSSGTKVWVNGCGTTYARLSDLSNYVTTDTAQTISGVKTFSNGVKVGSANINYDSTNKCLKFTFD